MKTGQLSKRITTENIGIVTIGIVCLIVVWSLPMPYYAKLRPFITGLVAAGITFDLFSLAYHLSTLIMGRFISGIYLSIVCYPLFLLMARFSLVAPHQTALGPVLLFKLVDAFVLGSFFCLCHWPDVLAFRRRAR